MKRFTICFISMLLIIVALVVFIKKNVFSTNNSITMNKSSNEHQTSEINTTDAVTTPDPTESSSPTPEPNIMLTEMQTEMVATIPTAVPTQMPAPASTAKAVAVPAQNQSKPKEKQSVSKNSNNNSSNNGSYTPASDTSNSGGWKFRPDLSDEFTGSYLDSNKWYNYLTYWKGRQPSIFSTSNVNISSGKLCLTTKYETTPEMAEANKTLSPTDKKYEKYTTACVQSKQLYSYGYYEMKAKIAPAAVTSSFWFQETGADGGTEIDVIECVGRSKVYGDYQYLFPSNLHCFTGNWASDIDNPNQWRSPYDLTQDYHIYGLSWEKDYIKMYFDGKEIRNIVNKYNHYTMHLFFDMETFECHGYPSKEELPATFYIEYFRAWTR